MACIGVAGMNQSAIERLLKKRQSCDGEESFNEHLLAVGSWPETWHRVDIQLIDALVAAVGSGRPLLVSGEPGSGKSHSARAAAALLGWPFISTVVQPQTEYDELLWTVDLTSRLAEAQMSSFAGQTEEQRKLARQNLAIESFICPGPLWYAYRPDHINNNVSGGYRPEAPVGTADMPPGNVVLLIDEIDKADITLCNGLLEVLGNGSFFVPELGEAVTAAAGRAPLIIITSNNTRDLPPAFLRRCATLSIEIPDAEFEERLVQLGLTHFDHLPVDLLHAVAAEIARNRLATSGFPRVGQAEYLDLLRALNDLDKTGGEDKPDLMFWLKKLAPYFNKYR